MLECSYPIPKFTVFIGVGCDFLQCCSASFQFVTVATHLHVVHAQTQKPEYNPQMWQYILLCVYLCVHMHMHVWTYFFLINISQEAGSYPVIQINLYKINFKEEVIPET